MGRRLCILALAGILAGCGGVADDLPVGSYERGVAEIENERYFDAIEDLKLFVRRNPTDPRVDDAQYQIGMARFQDEDYPVAAVEFEILRTDYPSSELVEDAWYMEGMCYREQVPDIVHEQTVTRKALQHFERFLQRYPDGEYAEQARTQVRELREHLDRKRLAAVRLYRRLHRPEAALVTLEALLNERPDSALRPEMLFMAGELSRRTDDPEKARRYWETLIAESPDTDFARRARRNVDSLSEVRSAGSS